MDTIGVGVVGASPGPASWAANAHVPAITALPEYALEAVATSRSETAEVAGRTFGVRAYADAPSLIEDPAVDLVVVGVKVTHHHDVVAQAIEAGKMVFCEWPLGVDLADAVDLADRAQAAGVRTVVGMQARFSPAVRKMRELVESGYVGDVLSMTHSAYLRAWGGVTDRAHAYMFDKANGATVWSVGGGHTLEGVEYVLGPVAALRGSFAVGHRTVHLGDTGEDISATAPNQLALSASFASGAVGTLSFQGDASRIGPALRWEVHGTEGDLVLTGDGPNGNMQVTGHALTGVTGDGELSPIITDGYSPEIMSGLPDDPSRPVETPRRMAALYQAFARDVREGTSTVPDFRRAVEVHRLLDSADG